MVQVKAASVVWGVLSIVFGWTLFGYWWIVVLGRTAPAETLFMLAILGILAVLITISAWGWIVHNRKLARRGTRGRATPFRTPQFHRDGINRQLVLPDRQTLQESAVVVITANAQEKSYLTSTTDQTP